MAAAVTAVRAPGTCSIRSSRRAARAQHRQQQQQRKERQNSRRAPVRAALAAPHHHGHVSAQFHRSAAAAEPEQQRGGGGGQAASAPLANPLKRLEQLGPGWLGAIWEWEGVVVAAAEGAWERAWLALAEETGRPPPPAWMLRRARGMKAAQAVSEVLCWARDPSRVRELARRHEQLVEQLGGVALHEVAPGVRAFLEILKRHNVPCAAASVGSARMLEAGLGATGLRDQFDVAVSGDDAARAKPDPELYLAAARMLERPPERCIVLGNGNTAVEAAHECGMKCVAVANSHPIYELTAADLVVRDLRELSVVNFRNLIAASETLEPEPELEPEPQQYESPAALTAFERPGPY
eukprot:jgi/Chlat1/5876/Chrsp4S06383